MTLVSKNRTGQKSEQKHDINILQHMYNLILQDRLCTRNVGSGRQVFSQRVIRSLFCCETDRLSAVCLVSPSGRWSETSLSSEGSSPLEPVDPSGRSSKVLGGLKSVSSSLHRLLLLQLDLCGRTFPHDCRETRRRRAMSVTRCSSDVRSEEIKPADVHLTSCFFHRSSLISDFKLKSTKRYWCLGVKSKFDPTGSWPSTEWTWAHTVLTTHVVNVSKWPLTPRIVPDVNMMRSDTVSVWEQHLFRRHLLSNRKLRFDHFITLLRSRKKEREISHLKC